MTRGPGLAYAAVAFSTVNYCGIKRAQARGWGV